MSVPPSQATREVNLRRRALGWPTLISFALGIALLVFFLTRFDIDFSATWRAVRHSNAGYFALAVLSYYVSFLFRGWRWRTLVRNAGAQEGAGKEPSFLGYGSLILLGWFANNITWLRLGDAYRAFVLSQRTGGSFLRTAGTVLAERMLEVLVIVVLLLFSGIGVLTRQHDEALTKVALASVALAGAVLIVLAVIGIFGRRITRLMPPRARQGYLSLYEGTAGSFRKLPGLGVLSVLGWAAESGRLFFVIYALGLQHNLSTPMIIFATLAASMLTTIPITPGGLGFVEAGLVGLLVGMGLTHESAVAAAVLDRSITYLSVLITGGALFAFMNLSQGRELKQKAPAAGG